MNQLSQSITRRHFLFQTAHGFAGLALTAMLAEQGAVAQVPHTGFVSSYCN